MIACCWMPCLRAAEYKRVLPYLAREDKNRDFVPDRLGELLEVEGTVTTRMDLGAKGRQYGAMEGVNMGLGLTTSSNYPLSGVLQPGDVVQGRGKLIQVLGNELLELHSYERVRTTNAPAGRDMLASQAAREASSGLLVRVEGEISPATNFSTAYPLFHLTDRSGSISILLLNTEFSGKPAFLKALMSADSAQVTGVIGQWKTNPPYNTNYFIGPRSPADMVFKHKPPWQRWAGAGAIVLLGLLTAHFWRTRNRMQRSMLELEKLTNYLQQAQNALQQSDARFQAFMNKNPAVAWMKDAQGRYVYVNGTLQEVYKLAPADILGKTDFDILPKEVAEELVANDKAVLSSGVAQQTIERIPKPSGEINPWQVWKFPFKDSAGEWYAGGLAFDIAEKVRAETHAKEQELKFEVMFANAPLGIAIADEAMKVSYLNLKMVEIFGFNSVDDLLETPVLDRIAPEHRNLVAERAHQRRTGQSVEERYEVWGVRQNGTRFPAQLQVCRIPYKGEMATAVFLTDLTSAKSLEEQLRHSQKMESIGQLAGGVAHDFNNLLTIIQGHTSLLKTMVPEEPIGSSLHAISAAADRAAALTRQLLLFSRRQKPRLEPLNPNESIAKLSPILRASIPENIQIELKLEEAVPLVAADPTMFDQVILNLALNARDAMPLGGNLTIETSSCVMEEGPARNLEAVPGVYARISVNDTGSGIPESHLPRIFEPFFTTKEVGKGTGLGLATVHGILKEHCGWIEVKSTVGEGSSFVVYLPRSTGRAVEAAVPLVPPPENTGTILVLEDEKGIRMLLESVLKKLGHRTLVAQNTNDGKKFWVEHRQDIDVVIADLMLAERMTGFDFARSLREERPELPVIFISGYTPETTKLREGLKPGEEFLAKPFSIEALRQAVNGALKRKENPAQTTASGSELPA